MARTLQTQFAKKEEVYGFQTLFRELGYYISRLEHYEKSLKFFDEAIKKTPNNKRSLIGRSRARAKACQYEGAIADINKALSLDPDDFGVLADKALNTYLSCEFEEGLVQNTRLLPLRKKPDYFSMGVMHCSNAIENCVGERAGRPLRDHFRIIRKLAWKKNNESQKPFEPRPKTKKVSKKNKKDAYMKEDFFHEPVQPRRSKKISTDEERVSIRDSLHTQKSETNIIPAFNQPFPFYPLQHYTTNIENYMAEKYLDSIYLDKIFLKKLQTEPGAKCPNKKGSSKIKHLAKTGFKTVSYKQELLRTRRPFYYIKYQEATSSGALKSRQEEELTLQQQTAKKEADAQVARLKDAYKDRKLRVLLELAEKLKQYCDSKPKRLLPDKNEYLKQMYEIVRDGFFDLYRLNTSQYDWDQEKRICLAFGLPISREPSNDSVITQFKNVFEDYKKQILVFGRRLKHAETSEEMCWCYHELCRYHIEVKHWDLAKVYGRKCTDEARLDKNWPWVVNGTMLLTKLNIQQHNKNDAKSDINNAIKIAERIKNPALKDYLNKCMEVIEKIEFDNIFGPKVLEKREKKILAMMGSEKMKDEMSHLFRMMAAMPANRRMSVMPGIRAEVIEKRVSRRVSILPDSKLPVPVPKRAMGDSLKKADRGVGFMELIQYHV